jgi:hypothetical protein
MSNSNKFINTMKTQMKLFLFALIMGMCSISFSQVQEIKLNPVKVKQFTPYLQHRHGGAEGFEAWKSNNKLQYTKEMWYFSDSFYIKRNQLAEGISMDESQIDITRFENQRKENEEATITMPGFKDVIVLLPAKKLIYKP